MQVNSPAPLQVKADVLPYCVYDEETRLFIAPPPALRQSYTVVVCTCAAAGAPAGQCSHRERRASGGVVCSRATAKGGIRGPGLAVP